MRVSIVATALDGQQPESKSVINMVHRIQNRNPGYHENLLSFKTIQVLITITQTLSQAPVVLTLYKLTMKILRRLKTTY